MSRIAIIPDLELYDREIGHTRGYSDESLKNLDDIIDKIIENNFDMALFAGDLVYNPFRSETYRAQVYRRFMRLNNYLSSKMPDGVKIVRLDGETEVVNNTIFAVQGNHDKSPNKETFFKFLLDTGMIYTPIEMYDDQWSINLLHYQKDAKAAIEQSYARGRDASKYNIDAMHLELDGAGIINAFGELTSYGWNLLKADLTIAAHLHNANELVEHERSDGTKFRLSVPGSIGRTKLNMSTQRDFAQFVTVNLLTREEKHEAIDLKNWQEFFDLGSSIRTQRLEKSLGSYSKDLEIHHFKSFDPKEMLNSMGLPQDVLETALSYISQ